MTNFSPGQHPVSVNHHKIQQIKPSSSAHRATQLEVVITELQEVRVIQNALQDDVYLRYGFADSLGSLCGETDSDGRVMSREEYYSYGSSAGADEEVVEIADRTRRYGGKERDVSGLLYYGWRYLQPDLGRWLSADPGGLIDGANLYRFCANNPSSYTDSSGLQSEWPDDVKQAYHNMITGGDYFRGLSVDDYQAGDIDQVQNLMQRISEINSLKLLNDFNQQAKPVLDVEDHFLDAFMNSEMSLVHFTRQAFHQVGGEVNFLSRAELENRQIPFNHANTHQGDIEKLATTHFAFFSLSLSSNSHKISSRFGNARYHAPISVLGEKKSYSMLQTHDLIDSLERPNLDTPLSSFLSADAPELIDENESDDFQDSISLRFGADESGAALGSFYLGDDMHDGLLYSVMNDINSMSDKARSLISTRITGNVDEVVQYFYRPQVLVPGGLKIPRGKYGFSAF